jgi:hypothetical protein
MRRSTFPWSLSAAFLDGLRPTTAGRAVSGLWESLGMVLAFAWWKTVYNVPDHPMISRPEIDLH